MSVSSEIDFQIVQTTLAAFASWTVFNSKCVFVFFAFLELIMWTYTVYNMYLLPK